MAQERGAAGSGAEEPGATGGDLPDSPELWGNRGLVGDGRYRLTHRLGRGGMAEVFAAEDVRLGRIVAVKLLRSDLAEDPVSKARFTREAQSVAGLNHHAVVAVYDSGEETVGGNVVPYMVMELVDGRTIRELLNESEAPSVEQALVIVSGVLEALAYSHQHGIVHRDIKPANVIITDTGSVKVMDFGIARALHGAASTMTQTGMVMGTPQYLSPEQALGKAIDTRSDLYAVGCLLYELLALRPPFTGETPLSVVYQHVQDTPRLPSEVSSSPPELDGMVMRSLAKEPDDRFQSAEEMRGLVQYALRMLEEHGSHTNGLWNTGAVAAGGTPPMGTRAMAASDAPTGQLGPPLLLGHPGDDGEGTGGGAGGKRRMALIGVVALLLIVGTTVLALTLRGDGDDGPGENPGPAPSEVDDPADDEEEPAEPAETDEGTEPPWTPGYSESHPPQQGDSGGGWGSEPPETGTGEPTETETGTGQDGGSEGDQGGDDGDPGGEPSDPGGDTGETGADQGGEPGGANQGATDGTEGAAG
ncbi:protein kinase [Streptomyces sodiiphilus]|uniref:non-specific serine/threonine protein kinase n=1 Tax=Streptomyces sodiiphilus TaxID=226217 RepID=A0ABN2P2E3_9ACTN